ILAHLERITDDHEFRKQVNTLTQKKNELQIQLDLATKTKEELAEELQKEKGWWGKWSIDKKK
ncbi:16570_t:CDS:2, partial [Racocetra fulgida]